MSAAAGIVAGTYAEKNVSGAGSLTANMVDKVVLAPFSKGMELEADETALTYMKNAGYDLKAALAVLRRFGVEIPVTQEASFMATHPASPERYARLEMLIEKGGNA